MEIKSSNTVMLYHLFIILVLGCCVANSIEGFAEEYDTVSLKRSSFPEDFIFGTSSSSYQYEGAVNEGGKGPSIWDTFTKQYPNKIRDQSDGHIATDSYHRFKEDVQIMEDIGFDAYRFSISWSRLLPGLTPFVTLFHSDYPQSLEDAYGGFLSPQIVKDFTEYAEVCFKAFGDRVKHWVTLNGPYIFSQEGYAKGVYAPGRCSNCTQGDSATEPYLVSHHQLLAHAAAVKLYRGNYQSTQRGQIGIIQNTEWVIPLSQSTADIDAASRVKTFTVDWLMEPLNSGSYPVEMVSYLGERLPKFSKEQSAMLKNSFDFIGINYYSTAYAADAECPSQNKTYLTDSCAELTYERDGVPIGPRAASEWIYL